MARTVGIGIQSYCDIIKKDCFYVDKTGFIREWWESEDSVTLITRPAQIRENPDHEHGGTVFLCGVCRPERSV